MADVVSDFVKNPYTLSALSEQDRYYDYLALLHLILIKKGIKNGFCLAGSTSNGIKICKKLKLLYAKADHITCSFTVSDENSLSEETTKELVNRHTGHGIHDIICAREIKTVEKYSKEYFDPRSVGELEEYPNCCIEQFVKNVWGDYESIAKVVGDSIDMVDQIYEFSRDCTASEKIFERQKFIQLEYGLGCKKFPYVIHQACSECLNGGNESPTGKLNSKWKQVCENEFGELNKEILLGAEREYKDKLWWDQSYSEYMKGYFKQMG